MVKQVPDIGTQVLCRPSHSLVSYLCWCVRMDSLVRGINGKNLHVGVIRLSQGRPHSLWYSFNWKGGLRHWQGSRLLFFSDRWANQIFPLVASLKWPACAFPVFRNHQLLFARNTDRLITVLYYRLKPRNPTRVWFSSFGG